MVFHGSRLDSQLPSLISLFIFVWSISEAFRSKSKEQLNERRAGLSNIPPPLLPQIDRLCRTRSPICQVWFAGALLRKVLRGGVRKWCKKKCRSSKFDLSISSGCRRGGFFQVQGSTPSRGSETIFTSAGNLFQIFAAERVPSTKCLTHVRWCSPMEKGKRYRPWQDSNLQSSDQYEFTAYETL